MMDDNSDSKVLKYLLATSLLLNISLTVANLVILFRKKPAAENTKKCPCQENQS